MRHLLRYYVVSQLLRESEFVKNELFPEMVEHLSLFEAAVTKTRGEKAEAEAEVLQFKATLNEMRNFVSVDRYIQIVDSAGAIPPRYTWPDHRLPALAALPAGEAGKSAGSSGNGSSGSGCMLQDCIVASGIRDNGKFGELTIDMYRIVQLLEWSVTMQPKGPGPKLADTFASGSSERRNPHKYLEYRPTAGDLLVKLHWAMSELPPDGIMLVYLAAKGTGGYAGGPYTTGLVFEGSSSSKPSSREGVLATHGGGGAAHGAQPPAGGGAGAGAEAAAAAAATNLQEEASSNTALQLRETAASILYPGDLLPLTRKPLCLIVDSNSSAGFAQVASPFGTPVVALLSPADIPDYLKIPKFGSLFSFFLNAPLEAFVFVTQFNPDAVDATPHVAPVLKVHWRECDALMGKLFKKIRALLADSGDATYRCFLEDPFVSRILVHFIFCFATLRMHRDFGKAESKSSQYIPSIAPPLPNGVADHVTVVDFIRQVADILGTSDAFDA